MRFALAWIPALAVAALIYWLSAIPGLHATSGLQELVLRKGAHFSIYGLLAAACWRGLGAHGVTPQRRIVGAWLLAVAYAATDEIHQIGVPNRVGSPFDAGVDAAGAAFGLAVLLVLLDSLRLPRQPATR